MSYSQSQVDFFLVLCMTNVPLPSTCQIVIADRTRSLKESITLCCVIMKHLFSNSVIRNILSSSRSCREVQLNNTSNVSMCFFRKQNGYTNSASVRQVACQASDPREISRVSNKYCGIGAIQSCMGVFGQLDTAYFLKPDFLFFPQAIRCCASRAIFCCCLGRTLEKAVFSLQSNEALAAHISVILRLVFLLVKPKRPRSDLYTTVSVGNRLINESFFPVTPLKGVFANSSETSSRLAP